jgi:hypothetical protein
MNKDKYYIDNPYPKTATSKFKVRVPSYKGRVFPFSRYTNYFESRQEAQNWLDGIIKKLERALKSESKDQEHILDMNKLFKTDYIQDLGLKIEHYKSLKVETK